MGIDFSAFALLAVALGVKHAFDADHLLAVSNLLTRSSRVRGAAGLASSWALGHLVTAAAVSAVLYFFADAFLEPILQRLELLVPILLIVVGLLALGIEARRLHAHRHRHQDGGPEHRHFHVHFAHHHRHGAMAGIGVVHGLASNDELLVVLLIGLGADAWWELAAGVGLFSLGVLAGMVLYAATLHTAATRLSAPWVGPAINVSLAIAGVAYAVYLLAGGAGLNLLDAWVR